MTAVVNMMKNELVPGSIIHLVKDFKIFFHNRKPFVSVTANTTIGDTSGTLNNATIMLTTNVV